MSNLLSPDTFDFFAKYLLAGFIIISVRSRFVVAERPKAAETIFEAVILSLINQVLFLLAWPLCMKSLALAGIPIGERWPFFAEILLLPALLGMIAGWNLSFGWNHALLRRLSMPVEHPTRRAYDYAFTHDRPAGFVILTFTDGTQVFGYYGSNSLAANDSGRSDIYLERLYDVDEAGQWAEKSVGRSAFVSLSGIRSIEFLDNPEFQDGKDH
ncbi:hypothetical protein LA6_001341 [Marinibacterium anthonyi]|nr:hypothetical protein LA6_001341 [Marinibacterium anthonyi]